MEGIEAMLPGKFTRRQLLAAAPLLATPGALRGSPLTPAQPLNFLVVGDWGRDGEAYQRHVAWHMAKASEATGSRFVVSTGDNFYNLGVSSANDRK